MNNKTMSLLLLLTLAILIGTPVSFAKPEYLNNLKSVYGTGSCLTCHVNPAGDGPRTAYGTLFEEQFSATGNVSAALIAIGAPTTTQTPASTQATQTATSSVTTAAAGTTKAPGFGIVLTAAGLFTCALLLGRRNK